MVTTIADLHGNSRRAEMKWERRYRFYEFKTAIFENPEAAVDTACGLIRGVAEFGTRQHLLKIFAELQRVLSADDSADDLASR